MNTHLRRIWPFQRLLKKWKNLEACPGPCQISKVEIFAKIVNG